MRVENVITTENLLSTFAGRNSFITLRPGDPAYTGKIVGYVPIEFPAVMQCDIDIPGASSGINADTTFEGNHPIPDSRSVGVSGTNVLVTSGAIRCFPL